MYCQISDYDLCRKCHVSINFVETLNLRHEALRGFPRSVPWELFIPTTSCNFDFHAWYARKSSKLRARSRRESKTPRAGYWIPFLKTFVTRCSIYERGRLDVDSALHKRITYQWTDSMKNLHEQCILYFRPLPWHSKNPPYVNEGFIYQISVWKIIFPAGK